MWFSLAQRGVVEFSADGQLSKLESEIPTDHEFLVAGPDDDVYLLGSFVARIVEDHVDIVTTLDVRFGAPSGATFAFDGLWVAGESGLARYANAVWSSMAPDDIPPGPLEQVYDVEIDREGRPWVIAEWEPSWTAGLYRLDDKQRWEFVRGPKHPSQLHRGPDGELYVHSRFGLSRVRYPEPIVEIPLGGVLRVHDLSAISPTGLVVLDVDADPMGWVETDEYSLPGPDYANCELVRVDPNDPASMQIFTLGKPGECPPVDAVAIDGSNRIWASSDMGLFVLGPDTQVRVYPRGSLPELADKVESMLVLGLGPTTLPDPPPVQTGTLIAKVLLDEKPLAKAKIEICRRHVWFANRTRCADDPTRVTARTDAKGVLRIDALPLGPYELFIRVEGAWDWRRIPADCIRADAICDLGTIYFW